MVCLVPCIVPPALPAQNVVAGTGHEAVAEAIRLADADVLAAVAAVPDRSRRPDGPETARVAAKLDAHVAEFVDGFPWMAFHNTLGISGYETYFNHPDRVFHALALALPYLTPATAKKAKAFLADQLAKAPPYAVAGYDNTSGRPREAYDVPPPLRIRGKGRATSAVGVYAFWAYVHAAKDTGAAEAHWPAVRTRMEPLLGADDRFDPAKRDRRKDEAQRLTGDAAGLIGFVRLARMAGDAAAEKRGLARARQVLTLRINLDRIDPGILEKTESTTAHLHAFKLARHCDLVLPVGELLRTKTDGLAAKRLAAFRGRCNGWYQAFGDRYIGGENYTSPPHFARSLFAGAAYIERLDAGTLLAAVDVPWCRGDLFFIEKCALALWASAGRPMERG
jgi:hypothetical protein